MKKMMIALLICLLSSIDLFSQIYYVKTTGNDNSDGRSWATAFRTLQKSLSVPAGQVWVAAGTYFPDQGPSQTNDDRNASFILKNNLALYGGFAGNEIVLIQRNWITNVTTLSGEIQQDNIVSNNSNHIVTTNSLNATAILDGFTITAAYTAGSAAGMYNLRSSPTIKNCSFTTLVATGDGAGMYNSDNSSPIIDNCSFTQNQAGFGGGIYNDVDASPTISNCIFTGNTATGGGAIGNDNGSSPVINNCRFLSNMVNHNSGAIANYNYSRTVVNNCIFLANSAGSYGGAIGNYYHSKPTIINSSFSGNSTAANGGIIYNNDSSITSITNSILWDNSNEVTSVFSSSAVINYSIVKGGYGTTNLSANPLFIDSTQNLHLKVCSPAIDKGYNDSVHTTIDLDGNPRMVNNRVDIGAYEYQGYIVYVNEKATGTNNGDSWANAFTHLQDALKITLNCTTPIMIWVAQGTYYPDEGIGYINNDRNASFVLKNHVAILGGFDGTETSLSQRFPAKVRSLKTILSGEIDGVVGNAGNSYHVVRSEVVDSSAILDGFTISDGVATGSIVPTNYGGGLYNTGSPTISYCTFIGNMATHGGGVYNAGAASFINDIFIQNRSVYGGGMFNSTHSPSIINPIFWQNIASGEGGAIYNTSTSPKIVNGTFYMNSAPYGSGIRNVVAGSPVITNCILWGDNNQISNQGNTPSVTYSLVQGAAGMEKYTADSLFRNPAEGDLHTFVNSPARDAGNNAAVTIDTDNDGDPRITNGIVDIGADEYYPGGIGGPEPPKLNCPGDFTLTADPGSCGTVLAFTGSHAITVTGGEEPITITYNPAGPGTFLPVGSVLVNVTAKDAIYRTVSCSFWITVADSSAPEITNIKPNPAILYPPNHQMQDITLDYNATDNCGTVTTTLSVSSSEGANINGAGNTATDWQVIDDHHIKLRAERSGTGSDRIYTITVHAMDAAGNTTTATTTVSVPHDKAAVTKNKRIEGNNKILGLQVSAAPNPFTNGFTLTIQSAYSETVNIRVLDALGRLVESRSSISPNGELYYGESYRPGVYYVQVIQAGDVVTIKLIKHAN